MNAASEKVTRKTRSALWLAIHGWLGLPIWAFLFFICLTGSVATVSEEIIWLFEPAARSNPPSADARRLGYDEIMQRVQEQEPGTVVMFITVPVKDIYAIQFYVGRPDGTELTIYVNPYTGAIQGEKSTFDLRELLRALHGWLLIPFTAKYSPGWYIVSAMSIPLMGSLITGLVVYKKFWRGFLRPRLRVSAGWRVFWGDLHRLAGLWSIPFIAIMSVTAMWFLIEAVISDAGYKLPGEVEHPHVARPHVPAGATRQTTQAISLDQAIEVARQSFPNMTTAFVELPMSAYHPIEIFGRGAYPLVFEIAYISPYSGKVLAARGIGHRSTLALITESMRPLHTGDFAGLWLKLMYFIFGLLLSTLVFSGMMVWTKRSVRATAQLISDRRKRLAATPQLGAAE
jgi:uncharacterized iron-regulated membrane protein